MAIVAHAAVRTRRRGGERASHREGTPPCARLCVSTPPPPLHTPLQAPLHTCTAADSHAGRLAVLRRDESPQEEAVLRRGAKLGMHCEDMSEGPAVEV
jgi:hypothetical protein